jgi:hypothetical protein
MEGSVLGFLKTEWKVSDTDSVHRASSLSIFFYFVLYRNMLCSVRYVSQLPEKSNYKSTQYFKDAVVYILFQFVSTK